MKVHGISDGSKYTYKGIKQICQRIPKKWGPILKIPNACEIDVKGNEEALMKIIAQIGPVAGVMAVVNEFLSYQSGIFFEKSCVSATPNHAIVCVT